jgi:hypothetical protein
MGVHSVALRLGPALGVFMCYVVYVYDILDFPLVLATNCNSLYLFEPS